MADQTAYGVFLHQQAIDALGAAIKPYLIDSPAGAHLQCVEVDSGGSLFEMTLVGRNAEGRAVEVELMVPIAMIKLVVSVKRDGEFGFGLRESAQSPTDPASAAGSAPSTVAPGAAAT